ncbi:hypothetical protein RclHR1_08640002 [Rhizophagus clarus]|uniref:Uncharacterized protein n=1 Tax=Rhizophagus clarus TaxID=94130 RepID=A0A2Z6SFR6_9GLOM|nr:hypothetical protein RclHR1_08640002 [Rhizophagus clarus]
MMDLLIDEQSRRNYEYHSAYAKNLEILISASTEVVFQTDPEGVYGRVPEKCIMTYLEPSFERKMKWTMSAEEEEIFCRNIFMSSEAYQNSTC